MFELPWIALFVLTAPWFWILSIGAICTIIWALEEDSGVWATTIVVVFGLLVTFFGPGVEWIKWVAANPWTILWGVLAYITIGSVWGVIKWYFYVSDEREAYEDRKRSWLESKGHPGVTKVPPELKEEWTTYVCDNTRWGKWDYSATVRGSKDKNKPIVDVKPIAWRNKARITRWMAYWPFSMIWSLLDDIIRKVFRHIQKWLGNLMDRITEHVFRGVDDDFDVPEKKPEETKSDE